MHNKDIFKTILVIVIGCVSIGYIFSLGSLYIAAIVIGVLSLMFSPVARWVHLGWFKFAEILGFVNSRIILGVTFYVVLFPIALVSRLFVKDPLMLKFNRRASLFSDRQHRYAPQDFEQIW